MKTAKAHNYPLIGMIKIDETPSEYIGAFKKEVDEFNKPRIKDAIKLLRKNGYKVYKQPKAKISKPSKK